MRPGGDRRELEIVYLGELVLAEGAVAPPGLVLRGAVEPDAAHPPAREKRLGGGGPRPILGAFDQTLFAAVAEQVAEPLLLRLGLVADDDVRVASAEQLLPPVVEPSDLLGDVASEVRHEGREGLAVLGEEKHVAVVRQASEGADLDRVALGGLNENAVEHLDESPGGTEQVAAVDGLLRDLDERSWRYPAWIVAHSPVETGNEIRF
jgi:hypothetical protein